MRLALNTKRLTLRPPEDADAGSIARYLGDVEIARMTTAVPHPYTEEVALGWILMARIQHAQRKAFSWMMVERKAGVLGGIGVFKRTPDQDWEIGYWVAKPYWRRGYAREAVAAVIDWARADLGVERLIAGHFEDNDASAGLLAASGFAPTGASCNEYSIARGGRARCIGMARELTAKSIGAS